MDERLRFVAKLFEGESMTEVFRQLGTSRRTGYKISASSARSRIGSHARSARKYVESIRELTPSSAPD